MQAAIPLLWALYRFPAVHGAGPVASITACHQHPSMFPIPPPSPAALSLISPTSPLPSTYATHNSAKLPSPFTIPLLLYSSTLQNKQRTLFFSPSLPRTALLVCFLPTLAPAPATQPNGPPLLDTPPSPIQCPPRVDFSHSLSLFHSSLPSRFFLLLFILSSLLNETCLA
ncbi:hypothetical protein B0J13DRAFT_29806 [Dactylonectria estremocensis]|uniref:Uncharacterized protein n=1 Tax=Dactylonectria estremocensis TaxID=1079267 RepID=A0A9P9JLH1_9HYPO|nr:hypothetical protein B0J13DRAFT_29806 [Dactylonectria estremocensis]